MLTVDDEGDVRVVTLDRPQQRNALTPAGLDALGEAVADADAPVVYLRGAGDAFCAGADLATVAEVANDHANETRDETRRENEGGTEDGDENETGNQDEHGAVSRFVRRGQRAADAVETADAVVVAGIDGAARGGGVELALACDLRVATPRATFGEPGVTFGLFGAWGGTVRLPEVVGMGDALDFSLSGRVVDAEEALRMGLVSRVVEDPRAVADDIAENDPSALEVVKARVRDRAPKTEQEAREIAAFERLVEEHAEALADVGSENRS